MKRLLFVIYLASTIVPVSSKAQGCSAANIDISASGNGNCEGNQMLLIIFVDDPNGPKGTFEWSRKNGNMPTEIPAITTDPFAFVNSFLAINNGVYYVTYTDSNGCTSKDSAELNVVSNPVPYITEIVHCYGTELIANDSFPAYLPYTYLWLEAGLNSQSITYTGSGGIASNQTVTVTNALGCSAQYFTGQLIQVPLGVTITGSRKIVLGGSSKLTANVNYPVKSYLWFQGNTRIVGAFRKYYTVVDTGTYHVRVTSLENCIVNKFVKITFKPESQRLDDGLEYVSSELSAYPNPTAGNIELGGMEIGESKLYDLTGRVIKIINSGKTNFSLSLDELIPGIYLLRSGDQSIRIVKQ